MAQALKRPEGQHQVHTMPMQMGWSSAHGEAPVQAHETRKMERDMKENLESLNRTIHNLCREVNVAMMQGDHERVNILSDEIENLRNLHTCLLNFLREH